LAPKILRAIGIDAESETAPAILVDAFVVIMIRKARGTGSPTYFSFILPQLYGRIPRSFACEKGRKSLSP
jgi:hypothetical protein